MDELKKLLETYMDENLEQLILSSPRKGLEEKKVRIRPVLLKGQLKFQAEIFREPRPFMKTWGRRRRSPGSWAGWRIPSASCSLRPRREP